MTTRSGTAFKPMEGTAQRLPAEGPTAHAEGMPAQGLTTTRYPLPELASLTEMVKMLLNDRERREKEIAAEHERMDCLREEEHLRQVQENEECLAETCRQMECLQEMFHEHSSASGSAWDRRSQTDLIKLTRLSEDDDVESYLTTFERIMAANEIALESFSFLPHRKSSAGLRSPSP